MSTAAVPRSAATADRLAAAFATARAEGRGATQGVAHQAHHPQRGTKQLGRGRRLEHHGRTGQLSRAHTDVVDLDMVGMTVATVDVVDGEHVSLLAGQKSGKPPGSLVHISVGEGAAVRWVGP